MNLGTTIKEIREKKGITQAEISNQTGLRVSTIKGIESGTVAVEPGKVLNDIATALDIPLDYIPLLSLERKNVKPEGLALYDALYPKMREWFIELLDKDPNELLEDGQ